MKLKQAKIAALIAFLAGAYAAAPSISAQQGPMRAPVTAGPSFRATHYDVTATLTPARQMLAAHATVDFTATDASNVVQVELHPNLQISTITNANGNPVTFSRDTGNPLQLRINLDSLVAPGGTVTLNFDYGGPLLNDENSPVPGVKLAYINADGAYLLQPARWFPLTFYPSNRYTGVFKIQVPEAFSVAGTGKTSPPQMISEKAAVPEVIKPGQIPPPPAQQKIYTFRDDRPEPSGTFVAAPFQVTLVDAGGIKVQVFTFPTSTQTAQLYGQDAGKMITDFSDEFGAIGDPTITVAEMNDGSVSGFAAPGLALISQRQWDPRGNTRLLSRLVAAQWFGVSVMPATSSDVWVTDGLARYCEAIYADQESGREAMNRAVEDFAVGALMYEDLSAVTQAGQLKPFTEQYRSVVEDKGAVVFHMIHSLEGDDQFKALLRDFYRRYAGHFARVIDFESLAQEFMDFKAAGTKLPEKISPNSPPPPPPANSHSMSPFFAQWLSSTGIPEFTVDYKVYRNQKGFQVIGKVKQSLDTFSMPMEMEVQTEGNPEFKTIQVTGAETPFTIDSFGRPKPGGVVLDPHDYILKASPQLRIRAIIARGESAAEQGKYMDAIAQYQNALDVQKNNALALFRMGEAFFFQKNYTAAANSFRSAIGGDTDLSTKWVEAWGHMYMGMIYDLTGQRDRAINEYRLVQQSKDNTGGAQDLAQKYMSQPYKEGL
ncbi:MAG TPA: M1 family aminopeptidase [Candidatus Limnocylindrales bacterium]|nr:M1 family aminopeptidase [Candidatus Limnocylindrales bacterium]